MTQCIVTGGEVILYICVLPVQYMARRKDSVKLSYAKFGVSPCIFLISLNDKHPEKIILRTWKHLVVKSGNI